MFKERWVEAFENRKAILLAKVLGKSAESAESA
jgi:hypothetical protein